jgi:hypothetical protein
MSCVGFSVTIPLAFTCYSGKSYIQIGTVEVPLFISSLPVLAFTCVLGTVRSTFAQEYLSYFRERPICSIRFHSNGFSVVFKSSVYGESRIQI